MAVLWSGNSLCRIRSETLLPKPRGLAFRGYFLGLELGFSGLQDSRVQGRVAAPYPSNQTLLTAEANTKTLNPTKPSHHKRRQNQPGTPFGRFAVLGSFSLEVSEDPILQ